MHATDIRNRMLKTGEKQTTPFEILVARKPRIDHYRFFGSHVWVIVPKEKRKRLDVESEGVVVGCLETSMHKVWLRDRQMAIFVAYGRVSYQC